MPQVSKNVLFCETIHTILKKNPGRSRDCLYGRCLMTIGCSLLIPLACSAPAQPAFYHYLTVCWAHNQLYLNARVQFLFD